MSATGIVLIVVFAIASLLLLLLLSPVKFYIQSRSSDGIKVFAVLLWFIKLGGNNKPEKHKHEKTDKPSENEKPKKAKLSSKLKKALGINRFDSLEAFKDSYKSGGLSGTFGKTIEAITFLLNRAKAMLKRIHLKSFNITFISGGTDAAETALVYGNVCAAVYPLAEYIKQNLKGGKNIKIDIGCDFNSEDTTYSVDMCVSLLALYAVICVIKTLKYLNKNIKEEEINETKSL